MTVVCSSTFSTVELGPTLHKEQEYLLLIVFGSDRFLLTSDLPLSL